MAPRAPAVEVDFRPGRPDSSLFPRPAWSRAARTAIRTLPTRERKVIGLYYYGEVTMKQIGAEIGVNESRVSQLHARAIRRLREALGEMNPQQVAEMQQALVAFAAKKPVMAKATLESDRVENEDSKSAGVVLQYKPIEKKRPAERRPVKVARARQVVAAAR